MGDGRGGGLRSCRPRAGGGGAPSAIAIVRGDIDLKVVVGLDLLRVRHGREILRLWWVQWR